MDLTDSFECLFGPQELQGQKAQWSYRQKDLLSFFAWASLGKKHFTASIDDGKGIVPASISRFATASEDIFTSGSISAMYFNLLIPSGADRTPKPIQPSSTLLPGKRNAHLASTSIVSSLQPYVYSSSVAFVLLSTMMFTYFIDEPPKNRSRNNSTAYRLYLANAIDNLYPSCFL